METLLTDLRYALRSLKKSPGFTIVAALTLALGIGANTAIFSVVQNVLLRPLPYSHSENLAEIWNTYPYLPGFDQAELSPGDFWDFKNQAKSFSQMESYINFPQGFNLTGNGDALRLEARYATSGFFSMLGVVPEAGRGFTPQEDKPGATEAVVISHRLWQQHFGSQTSIIGHTLTLDGRSYILAGVLPASFQLVPSADLWLPIGQYADQPPSHLHHEYSVVGRLKPGVTFAQAQAEIVTLNKQEEVAFPDSHKSWGVYLEPMRDPSAAKLRVALIVLFSAVGLVLLIACANIVNLLLARNAARQKEIALRVAMGASRSRLIGQLLTESTLLSLFGGALGIILAATALRILNSFVPAELNIVKQTQLNGAVLAFTLIMCVLTGIACGLLPALQTLKQDLHGILKEGGRTAGASGGHKIRNILVVSEVALALVPLVGAGLLIRSFRQLLDVNPGFRAERILAMEVDKSQLPQAELNKLTPEQGTALARKESLQFEEIAARIKGLPGVAAVGSVNVLPLGSKISSASRFLLEGQPVPPSGARPIAEIRQISLDYFGAMGIPLRAGRPLEDRDYGQPTIVINEHMAHTFWPDKSPVGQNINLCTLDPKPCLFNIVGVIGDVHQYGLEAAPTFDAYLTGGWVRYFVIRTSSDPAKLASAAIAEIHKSDASLPVTHVMTLDNLLSDSVSPRRFSMSLLGIFAALALLLAAVGIYGVMSYIVNLRTNEIGIRMALGAQPADVWKLIVGRGARLALVGVAIGLAGALALTRLIASLLYGVKATDPVTFATVAILLVGVALAACYLPARRAMRVDPMVALRHE
ncbi:MAG TPA: ABC transporter permease [Candidatus Acidoferrum sp.]|jgi:predicted permease